MQKSCSYASDNTAAAIAVAVDVDRSLRNRPARQRQDCAGYIIGSLTIVTHAMMLCAVCALPIDGWRSKPPIATC